MAEFERQSYIPPSTKYPKEIRLKPDVYEQLKSITPENKENVLNDFVMGQSVLELLRVSDPLIDFVMESFSLPLENRDIAQPYYNYVFFRTEGKKGNLEMNVLNTIDVSLVTDSEDHLYRFGIGIINMKQIGGFTNSFTGKGMPSHQDSVDQIAKYGIDLPIASESQFSVNNYLLRTIKESSLLSLNESRNRYLESK